MTWLTLRQFRLSALAVAALLVALAAVLLAVGRPVVPATDPGLSTDDSTYYYLGMVALHVFPAIIGAFWGAPLISREVENGTHRLVWNQGVTRTRWMLAKTGLPALAAVVATGLLSLLVTWWASPVDAIATENGPAALPIEPMIFGARGVVPMAYAVFAFTLGVAASALLRRTVPAMAVTLVLFTVFQVTALNLVRPELLPAEQQLRQFSPHDTTLYFTGGDAPLELLAPVPEQSWVLGQQTLDRAGNPAAVPAWFLDCLFPGGLGNPTPPPADHREKQEACYGRLADEGYQQRVTHQPNSRFWSLQWTETALYLALAGLLTWFALHWTRRIS
ncbi:ABC transporter permease subunit [Saccharothrix longispora]|uniref:ABC transporter permease subunit n=1 Tax=Saccharothrix longispora TaxID=33920 RepID=UPI0028FD21E7|nr:ABC transporter permease subunit [Saccharothrix longispora]MDU0288194.1 ABC transporter permease subunit [Saccharothrix longispora]